MKTTGEFLYKEFVGLKHKGIITRFTPDETEYFTRRGNCERALERVYNYMSNLEVDDPLISCEIVMYPAFGITESVELRIYYYTNGEKKTYAKQSFDIVHLETDTYGDFLVGKAQTLYTLLKEYVKCESNPKVLTVQSTKL